MVNAQFSHLAKRSTAASRFKVAGLTGLLGARRRTPRESSPLGTRFEQVVDSRRIRCAPRGTMLGVITARGNTMGSVEIEAGACEAFAQLPNDDGPISMLNLLRFRDAADYSAPPEQTSCSGREAYRRYIALAMPIVQAVGGRVIFMGSYVGSVIAPANEEWDDMLLVEYPSRRHFAEALTSAAYRAVVFHRTAALCDSRLIGFRGGVTSFQP